MQIHTPATTDAMCTLAVIARILTSDCDKCVCGGSSVPALYPKHPQHWCKMFCVCQHSKPILHTVIIQCHFLNLQEQLCLYGVNTSRRLVYRVCVCCCSRDYCARLQPGSSEERLRQAVLIGRQDARTLYRRAN